MTHTSTPTRIIISGTVDMPPENVEPALAAGRELIEGALTEPGCLDYDWCPEPTTPGRIRVYERWESEAALAAHFQSPLVSPHARNPGRVRHHGGRYRKIPGRRPGTGIRRNRHRPRRFLFDQRKLNSGGPMLEDEYAIHQLVARYADAVNRRSEADWAATWAEDAVWNLTQASASGRDNIVAMWVGAMANFPFVAQLVQNGTVEVTGSTASGRFYITEHLKFADGNGMFNIGVYQDKFVKTAEGWRFQERHYAVLYNDGGSGNMSGEASPYPALIG